MRAASLGGPAAAVGDPAECKGPAGACDLPASETNTASFAALARDIGVDPTSAMVNRRTPGVRTVDAASQGADATRIGRIPLTPEEI